MSTSVPVVANKKEELPLPQEILQDDFLLSQYLWDYISSFQSQCPSLKQRQQQQQQTESSPHPYHHSPSPTDGAADKGAGQQQRAPANQPLRLPGNPCRSLLVWRADRATTLITHNTQRYIASVCGSAMERKCIVAMQRHPVPLHTQWRGGRGEHAQQGQQQQQEKDVDKLT